MRVLVSGFHSGEFSPLLAGNSAIAQAANGCALLRNMIPRALGGAFQRPGFLYAGMQRNQSFRTRLLPFTFSSAVTYRIELGQGFARFWIGDRLCIHQPGLTGPMYLSTPGQALVLATPWTADEAFQVQFAQANDVTWLTHDNHWPRRLIRYGVEDWRIEEMPAIVPPLRDPNSGTTTLAASATSGNITLTAAGSDVFAAGDVGGYYEIAHRLNLPFADLELDADGDTTGIRVTGRWEVFSHGKWSGVLNLQSEVSAGVWETIRTWKSVDDFNVQTNGEVEGDTTLRLSYVGAGTAIDSVEPRAQLSPADATVRGLVKITGYTSPTVVSGTVVRPIHATTATKIWSEGAWSARRGFPRTVTLHGQRLVFAGTRSQGQTVWGSSVNGFDNFERTTLADAGFSYQIAATQSNAIVWLASQKGLLLGTDGDEWIMDGGTDGQSITAQSVRAERRSGFGSHNIQAALIGSAVVFVQNGGTVLNEYLFDFTQQGYEAIDLTELADHFGDERFIQFAYAQNPHSLIWAVTEEGSLLSLTYKRRNQTLAWAKHTTPYGVFESVCTTPGPAGAHEVWVTVRRTVDGVDRRTVERMDTEYWPKLKAGATTQLCVGDGATMKEMAAASSVTGLDHLEGMLVQIVADGAIHPNRAVTEGAVTLDRAVTSVVVGLAPTVELQPMPVELQMDTGSSFGRTFRVPEISLKVWQAGGSPSYADNPAGGEFDVKFRTVDDPTGQALKLYTGTIRLDMPARHQDTTGVILRNRSMLPLNILSMVMQVEVHGD